MTRLDDPAVVRTQYADESNFGARKAIYDYAEGPNACDVAFQAVADSVPRRVLEVGGGEGELAERIVRELGAELVFVDQSERMTNAGDHLAELRQVGGHDAFWTGLSFRSENGASLLRRSFSSVEAREAHGWVSIPDDMIWAYLLSMSAAHPPAELEPHSLPLRVRYRTAVFIATK